MMGDYSSQKAEIVYGWKGIEVKTLIHIPHGRDGAEAVDFLCRLVDGLSKQYVQAETDFYTNLRERTIGAFNNTRVIDIRTPSDLVPENLVDTKIPERGKGRKK